HLSEGYLRANRIEDATRLASQALDFARDHKLRAHEAWALRTLGEIAAHRDPPHADDAEASYRRAMILAEELGMRPMVAHCRLGLGKLCRRTGKREQAQEHLGPATTLYRDAPGPARACPCVGRACRGRDGSGRPSGACKIPRRGS